MKSFKLVPKQKKALFEKMCLLFADKRDILISVAKQRIEILINQNKKVLVISSILDIEEGENLEIFKTEYFLFWLFDSSFKFQTTLFGRNKMISKK